MKLRNGVCVYRICWSLLIRDSNFSRNWFKGALGENRKILSVRLICLYESKGPCTL